MDRLNFFNMIEGKKISAMLPKKWKKLSYTGVVIPAKMRFCNESNGEKISDGCINQNNENEDNEDNLNLLKRQTTNQFGYMLPYCNH